MAPRSVASLVNQQLLRWDSARKARASEQAGASAPCLAISKLPHSGGAEIGLRLAERLDYGLFGRELIDQIEREQGVQHKLLEGLDGRIREVIDRYVLDSIRRDSFTESQYLSHLVRTLRTLAERGMVVILGRGAAHILPPDRTLRILVVAPQGFRVERLAHTRGMAAAEAAKQLASEDRERRDFLRHHFGVTQDDPLDYDLVLNTGTLSLEGAVQIAGDALRDRFPAARRAAAGA